MLPASARPLTLLLSQDKAVGQIRGPPPGLLQVAARSPLGSGNRTCTQLWTALRLSMVLLELLAPVAQRHQPQLRTLSPAAWTTQESGHSRQCRMWWGPQHVARPATATKRKHQAKKIGQRCLNPPIHSCGKWRSMQRLGRMPPTLRRAAQQGPWKQPPWSRR